MVNNCFECAEKACERDEFAGHLLCPEAVAESSLGSMRPARSLTSDGNSLLTTDVWTRRAMRRTQSMIGGSRATFCLNGFEDNAAVIGVGQWRQILTAGRPQLGAAYQAK
jgi:hypothetical protein